MATSPTFPDHRIGRVDGLDRPNRGLFYKKALTIFKKTGGAPRRVRGQGHCRAGARTRRHILVAVYARAPSRARPAVYMPWLPVLRSLPSSTAVVPLCGGFGEEVKRSGPERVGEARADAELGVAGVAVRR